MRFRVWWNVIQRSLFDNRSFWHTRQSNIRGTIVILGASKEGGDCDGIGIKARESWPVKPKVSWRKSSSQWAKSVGHNPMWLTWSHQPIVHAYACEHGGMHMRAWGGYGTWVYNEDARHVMVVRHVCMTWDWVFQVAHKRMPNLHECDEQFENDLGSCARREQFLIYDELMRAYCWLLFQ